MLLHYIVNLTKIPIIIIILGETWLGESEGFLLLKGNSVLKQIGAEKEGRGVSLCCRLCKCDREGGGVG